MTSRVTLKMYSQERAMPNGRFGVIICNGVKTSLPLRVQSDMFHVWTTLLNPGHPLLDAERENLNVSVSEGGYVNMSIAF